MLEEMRKVLPRSIKEFIKGSLAFRLFYLRHTYVSRYPYAINIELTNKCNLHCKFCPRDSVLSYMRVGDMDFSTFENIVSCSDPIVGSKTSFTLAGLGDPLLYSMLPEAIAYIKRKYPQTRVHIDTNAIALSESLSERIIRSGLDCVLFSINAGSRESYLELMGLDRFDIVCENVRRFFRVRAALSYKTPSIVVQIMGTDITTSEVAEFRSYWGSLLEKQDRAFVRPIGNWAGQVDVTQLKKGWSPAKDRYPCLGPWFVTSIDIDGNVYPCCEGFSTRSKGPDIVLGNIHKESLLEIWGGAKMRLLKSAFLEGEFDFFPCKNCSAYTAWPNVWVRNRYLHFLKRKWF